MKTSNTLNALMFLMEKNDKLRELIDQARDSLIIHFEGFGIQRQSIIKTLGWLEDFLLELGDLEIQEPSTDAFRVLTVGETCLLDHEGYRFLLSSEQKNMLSPVIREKLLHTLHGFRMEDIDMMLIKWVALALFFEQSSAADVTINESEWMLLQDEIQPFLH